MESYVSETVPALNVNKSLHHNKIGALSFYQDTQTFPREASRVRLSSLRPRQCFWDSPEIRNCASETCPAESLGTPQI